MMARQEHLGYYFKIISDFLHAKANAVLKEHDITFSQLQILCYIKENGQKEQRQKEIELHFGLTHPSLVGLLKRMEQKGLVEIKPDPSDRRANFVSMTEKGEEMAATVEEQLSYTNALITEHLSEEEAGELFRILDIIYTKTCKRVCSRLKGGEDKEDD